MPKELPGRSGAIRRFTAAAAVTAAGAFVMAGCAAGQDAQTVNQRPPIDGASTDAGAISIRTASISDGTDGTYSKGGNAKLQLVIINNGPSKEELQSVSTPAADSAQVSNVGVNQTSSASASDSGSASASDSSSSSGSASASGSASPSKSATGSASASSPESGSASPSGSGPASTPIEIPAGQSVQVGFSAVGPNIVLTGLTGPLYPAQTVPVTFTFSNGMTVNLSVPVQLASAAPSAPVISQATEPTEG